LPNLSTPKVYPTHEGGNIIHPGLNNRTSYTISVRILRKWWDKIQEGEKTVEYRPVTEYYIRRIHSACKCLRNDIPVYLKLVCGYDTTRFNVIGIGEITVGPTFWEDIGLSVNDETKGKAYAIIFDRDTEVYGSNVPDQSWYTDEGVVSRL